MNEHDVDRRSHTDLEGDDALSGGWVDGQRRGEYCLAIEGVQAPVLVIDGNARVVEANRQLAAITGFSREELTRLDSRQLFPDDLVNPRPDPLGPSGRYRADGFVPDVVVNVARKNGSVFSARLVSSSAQTADHGAVHIVAVVNTAQMRLDETGLRGLLESAPDATLVLDPDGRIMVANQRAAGLFGVHRDQMDCRNISTLFSATYAEDAQAWFTERYEHTLHGRSLTGEVNNFPLHAIRADGREFPIEVTASALHVDEGMFLRVAVRDITERVRLQTGAEEMKAHFLATVSHELRTPLTSILGYAELLEDLAEADLGEQARRFVTVIARNARRELRLVDDLLTIVSIDGGQMAVTPRAIDLLQVVKESCEGFEPTAKAAGVRLRVDCPESEVPILGDPVRLGQALDNALSNAIKFSPSGGEVTMTVDRHGDGAEVQIYDQGPGIPLEERLRAFDRLFRGTQAVAHEKPGAGLGLTIIKAIIEAHQGSVTLHCPETGGTHLSFILPVDPHPDFSQDPHEISLHER